MKVFTGIPDLKDFIVAKSSNTSPFVVAVDGFGGSGKSTLCSQLHKALPDSLVITIDDFIKHPHEPNVFDHDWESFESKVLKRLRTSGEVAIKTYSWKTLRGVDDQMAQVKRYVFVDGIGLLEKKYRHYYDLMIWMDCPYEVALERGKRRDKYEQGADHDELWDTVWGPGSLKYFERVQPDEVADIIFKPEL